MRVVEWLPFAGFVVFIIAGYGALAWIGIGEKEGIRKIWQEFRDRSIREDRKAKEAWSEHLRRHDLYSFLPRVTSYESWIHHLYQVDLPLSTKRPYGVPSPPRSTKLLRGLRSPIISDYPDDWDKLRRKIYKRDGFRCANCGAIDKELHAHHIVPLRRGGTNKKTNLITLCKDCHKMLHPHMRK